MARPRTGTVTKLRDGRFKIGVTFPNGERGWKTLARGTSKAMARDKARAWSQRATNEPLPNVPGEAPRGESVAAYVERWLADRERRGLRSVSDDRGRLTKWVLPTLGKLPIAGVTRQDVEGLVEHLDRCVAREELHWRTAGHAWRTAHKLFSDSAKSKTRALRVRDDNPAADIYGPDRGAKRSLGYVYPSEFLALMKCETVPLASRRIVAVGLYTYLRTGELEALRWDDVDLEHGSIHVHRATVRKGKGETKETKTGAPRRIPIEPALLPLLQAMHSESGGKGRVLELGNRSALARKLRAHLGLAGVRRPELFTESKTNKALRFYDATRSSGITWCAVRGDDPLRIQQRAGHASFSTTEGYIREAENLRAGFGEVFPELPTALLGAGQSFHESFPEGFVPDMENESPETDVDSRAWEPPCGLEPQTYGLRIQPRGQHCAESAGYLQHGSADTPPTADDNSPTAGAGNDSSTKPEHGTKPAVDPVEAALAKALDAAADMRDGPLMAQLAKQLEERRLAVAGKPEPVEDDSPAQVLRLATAKRGAR